MLYVLLGIGIGFVVVERLWPSTSLPRVRAWWPRVVLVNAIQLGIVVVAGMTWDRWMMGASLVKLREHAGALTQGAVAYVIASFVYYVWHRVRHESKLFWLLCHQLHHSPRRIEVITAFYKHPVEILLNALLSSSIAYLLLGCTVGGAGFYTLFAGVAEFFYHWNVTTPHWLGYLIQRPESHRIHHQKDHHAQNYGDLPVFDMIFGTFNNPRGGEVVCGFDDWREDRFDDMLAFRDVHAAGADTISPLHFLPTCIGCSKKWACHAAKTTDQEEREVVG